ncbi:hypothetical protein NKH77_50750 [Streptomyces sp. M19]
MTRRRRRTTPSPAGSVDEAGTGPPTGPLSVGGSTVWSTDRPRRGRVHRRCAGLGSARVRGRAAVRRWELSNGGEDSPTVFWEVGVDGAVVTVRHGEAGGQERTWVEDRGSATAAEAYVAEAVRERNARVTYPWATVTCRAPGSGADDAGAAPTRTPS